MIVSFYKKHIAMFVLLVVLLVVLYLYTSLLQVLLVDEEQIDPLIALLEKVVPRSDFLFYPADLLVRLLELICLQTTREKFIKKTEKTLYV